MKAISLFAGAGGCSLGFKREGFELLAAFDNDRACVETYASNFKDVVCELADLSECDFINMRDGLGLRKGQLDLIIGGPPCQGFTTAGARSREDPRNQLVNCYVQAIAEFKPRWFMMENVEGILTTAGGSYIYESLKNMIGLGYSVFLKKAYLHEHGIPQRRKRVIVVGNREGKDFVFPAITEKAQGAIFSQCSSTLEQAIGDLEGVEYPAVDHIFKKGNALQQKRIKALGIGQTMKDLPSELQHDSFKRRAGRRVCDGTPSEKRGGAPSCLKRLSYSEPCLTITSCSNSELVHPIEDRCLTIRECARIQTAISHFAWGLEKLFKTSTGYHVKSLGCNPVFLQDCP